jgi:hypothetical protein
MAAPTKTAKREESSCQLGAVHTWHIASFRGTQHFGSFWGEADINRQTKPAGSVENDPYATLAAPNDSALDTGFDPYQSTRLSR